MARFNLNKGDRFNLTKAAALDNARVELSWDHADLDTQAWLLNEDGLIVNDEAFVFYNSENREKPFSREEHGNKNNWRKTTRPMSADGAVLGSIDDLSGGVGEKINICLNKVDPKVAEIAITATVNPTNEAKVFGDAQNAKIVVINEDTDEALCEYALGNDYPTEDAVVVAKFRINEDGEWEFSAEGQAYEGGLPTLVEMFAEE
ncbi:MAG: TerD family protein [Bacteroidales bacterium]|nr:TerD family protein [Bacteroidales bacterium]MCD8394587.1 TerD family protein [Bacteroidales bacterium]